jgi:hypothetical protein
MYSSPLTPDGIEVVADFVDNGEGVPAELSAEDAALILGVVVRRRERRRVAALLAQAELSEDQGMRDRLTEREHQRRDWEIRGLAELAQPDAIVSELLLSPEGLLLVNMLAAMVSVSMSLATGQSLSVMVVPMPFALWPSVPLGAMAGYSATPSAQARYLSQYLKRKVQGDVGERTIGLGQPTPAAEPHPHARRLWPPLRAWANRLSREAASNWVDAGRTVRHIREIEHAGLQAMAVYGRPMDRLRLPLDGVYPGPPFGLPLTAGALTPEQARSLRLDPHPTPDLTVTPMPPRPFR